MKTKSWDQEYKTGTTIQDPLITFQTWTVEDTDAPHILTLPVSTPLGVAGQQLSRIHASAKGQLLTIITSLWFFLGLGTQRMKSNTSTPHLVAKVGRTRPNATCDFTTSPPGIRGPLWRASTGWGNRRKREAELFVHGLGREVYLKMWEQWGTDL